MHLMFFVQAWITAPPVSSFSWLGKCHFILWPIISPRGSLWWSHGSGQTAHSSSNDSQKKSLIYLHSFLVNPEIIPGRMTLLVTIFLVLINIHNTIQTNSPKVKNVCWEDLCIWFSISSLCDVLFGAIVQSMAMKLRPNKILHRTSFLILKYSSK